MAVAVTYNKHQIYGILKNYHWMVNEIQKIHCDLSKTDFKGTAQYGISATLPTGKGLVSKALENEVIRRNEKSDRMLDYANKVVFINERRDRITDEKEKVILDCLLDGLSLTAISKHLGISRALVTDIRDNIVDKLAK
jgi:DNA-binding NarL/FixJ family response regulator